MSEQDEQGTGNVRRVSRKDRKKTLATRLPLIPPDDDLPEVEVETQAEVEETPAEVPPVVFLPIPTPEPVPPKPDRERFPSLDVLPQDEAVEAVLAEPRQRSTILPNIVAIFFLFATFMLILFYGLIAINPYTSLNPFPPFTPFPIIITTTPLPPTQTAIASAAPTATFTPLPAEGLSASEPFSFALASAEVIYIPNGNGQGCEWSSIAGSVTDMNGQPVDGLSIRASGNDFDESVFSGGALTYGAGGFEVPLGNAPLEAAYTVQLFSAQGAALSEAYTVVTSASCEQNVVVISFVQTRPL